MKYEMLYDFSVVTSIDIQIYGSHVADEDLHVCCFVLQCTM